MDDKQPSKTAKEESQEKNKDTRDLIEAKVSDFDVESLKLFSDFLKNIITSSGISAAMFYFSDKKSDSYWLNFFCPWLLFAVASSSCFAAIFYLVFKLDKDYVDIRDLKEKLKDEANDYDYAQIEYDKNINIIHKAERRELILKLSYVVSFIGGGWVLSFPCIKFIM